MGQLFGLAKISIFGVTSLWKKSISALSLSASRNKVHSLSYNQNSTHSTPNWEQFYGQAVRLTLWRAENYGERRKQNQKAHRHERPRENNKNSWHSISGRVNWINSRLSLFSFLSREAKIINNTHLASHARSLLHSHKLCCTALHTLLGYIENYLANEARGFWRDRRSSS